MPPARPAAARCGRCPVAQPLLSDVLLARRCPLPVAAAKFAMLVRVSRAVYQFVVRPLITARGREVLAFDARYFEAGAAAI